MGWLYERWELYVLLYKHHYYTVYLVVLHTSILISTYHMKFIVTTSCLVVLYCIYSILMLFTHVRYNMLFIVILIITLRFQIFSACGLCKGDHIGKNNVYVQAYASSTEFIPGEALSGATVWLFSLMLSLIRDDWN